MFQTKFSTHFCGFPGIRIQKRGLQAPLKNCQQATTTSLPLLPGIKRQGEELLSTRAWDRNPLGSGTSSTLESRGHWLAGGQARTRQREEAGNPAGEAWWLETRAMPGAGGGGGLRGHSILLQEFMGREDRVSSPSLGFQRGSMAPRQKQRPLTYD